MLKLITSVLFLTTSFLCLSQDGSVKPPSAVISYLETVENVHPIRFIFERHSGISYEYNRNDASVDKDKWDVSLCVRLEGLKYTIFRTGVSGKRIWASFHGDLINVPEDLNVPKVDAVNNSIMNYRKAFQYGYPSRHLFEIGKRNTAPGSATILRSSLLQHLVSVGLIDSERLANLRTYANGNIWDVELGGTRSATDSVPTNTESLPSTKGQLIVNFIKNNNITFPSSNMWYFGLEPIKDIPQSGKIEHFPLVADPSMMHVYRGKHVGGRRFYVAVVLNPIIDAHLFSVQYLDEKWPRTAYSFGDYVSIVDYSKMKQKIIKIQESEQIYRSNNGLSFGRRSSIKVIDEVGVFDLKPDPIQSKLDAKYKDIVHFIYSNAVNAWRDGAFRGKRKDPVR